MRNGKNNQRALDELSDVIGAVFVRRELLLTALTHSSYANEKKQEKLRCNERLEFLGDSILNLVISEFLFGKYPDMPEGDLTRIRASIVCEPTLAQCAGEMNLGSYLLLGHGEEQTGGRTRPSILSDAFEALIGALYLDGGYDKAKDFILKQMAKVLEACRGHGVVHDYKTTLQETVQKNSDVRITYEMEEETGPDHDKLFTIAVSISGKRMGRGRGHSKKEAEQNAAKAALEVLSK